MIIDSLRQKKHFHSSGTAILMAKYRNEEKHNFIWNGLGRHAGAYTAPETRQKVQRLSFDYPGLLFWFKDR